MSCPAAGPSLPEAFEGCLLGLAIGDALGFPVEFLARREILAALGPAGVTGFVRGPRHPPGTWTDDTQMTLAVAEALVVAAGGTLDQLMDEMGRRFVEWERSPENDRAPGGTCTRGCRRLAAGAAWRESGDPGSKGCGSAMRVAPIGLVHHGDRARLLEVARASSLPTHGHDAAIEGAAAAALLVSLALDRVPPAAMHRAVLDECGPRSADFRACLEKVPRLLDAEPEVALSRRGLGEAWVAEEAVASALWCFWRSPDDYRLTVLTAANTDGDSDSIACIAGGISGTYNGVRALPPEWVDGVERAGHLRDTARRLLAACDALPRG